MDKDDFPVPLAKYPPERGQAHSRVANAKRHGDLTPEPCEVCGAANTEAHHDDYERALDVRWLCRRDHLQHHREKERAAR